MSVVVRARGKVNLTLDVLGKRADGFHEVSMVMQSISLSDVLSFNSADGLELIWDPRGNRPPSLALGESNDILRAAKLLKQLTGTKRGAAIWLDKRLPIASGLGGGSADGAATLVGLNKLWQLNYTEKELMIIASHLGSDMPFCIVGGTAEASGRGEIIRRLPYVGLWHLAIFKPPQGISTKLVYTSLKSEGRVQAPVTELLVRSIEAGRSESLPNFMSNDLESVTFSIMPELQRLKERLLFMGAEKVMMSGSGPAVFALSKDEELAERLVRDCTPLGWWSSKAETAPLGCEFITEEQNAL